MSSPPKSAGVAVVGEGRHQIGHGLVPPLAEALAREVRAGADVPQSDGFGTEGTIGTAVPEGEVPLPAGPDPFLHARREAALVELLATGVVAFLKDVTSNDELPDDDGVLSEDGFACSNFLFEQAEPTVLEQEEDP